MASPAAAKNAPQERGFEQPDFDEVYDGDYVILAAGVVYVPEYDGADEYVVRYGPAARGSFKGIGFKTRGPGLELDIAPDLPGDIDISFGPEISYSGTRSGSVKDDVVDLLPKLDKVFELGFDGGVSIKKVITPLDSLSLGIGSSWDISGKGAGQSASVSLSYFTALSEGSGAGVSVGFDWMDGDYADYYFGITPEGSAATGGQLPAYDAKSGIKDWDAKLYYGIDLDGNFRNGGWGVAASVGYERLLNSAAETPITSIRGDRDQYSALIAIGYAF